MVFQPDLPSYRICRATWLPFLGRGLTLPVSSSLVSPATAVAADDFSVTRYGACAAASAVGAGVRRPERAADAGDDEPRGERC